MERLRISLFGGVSIRHGESEVQVCLARRVQVLLAYLLLKRHRVHPREEVMEALWPDVNADQARGRLNTALWRLRQGLEPGGVPRGTYLLTSRLGEVGFNWTNGYVLDTQIFEDAVQCALATSPERLNSKGAEDLDAALELYQGDLLPGNYEDWIIRERERLRSLYIDGLFLCLSYCKKQEQYMRALQCAQRILDLDQLREEVHREMMRLYLRNGQRARAVRQYQICRQALRTELGIDPMEETEALYSEIRHSGPVSRADESSEVLATSIDDIAHQIQDAISSFKSAELALRKITPLVEHLGHLKSDPRSKAYNKGH